MAVPSLKEFVASPEKLEVKKIESNNSDVCQYQIEHGAPLAGLSLEGGMASLG